MEGYQSNYNAGDGNDYYNVGVGNDGKIYLFKNFSCTNEILKFVESRSLPIDVPVRLFHMGTQATPDLNRIPKKYHKFFYQDLKNPIFQ